MYPVDLRSDTVTRPTPGMREAMARAEVGDDVFGDDPTVNRLQAIAAERLGKEAALFLPSGTQANLVALLSHCARGDEYIVGQTAHTYTHEGGGGAAFGGIQPQPLPVEPDGTLPVEKVVAAVRPLDDHYARTRLVCIENSIDGRALPMAYMHEIRACTGRLGLPLHLDGARLMNAAVHHGVDPTEITKHTDTVTLCLSKGLGAPVGSMLAGPRDLIREARRWRKVAGGGMRQAGVLAAAGIYALDRNVGRLAEDHENAALLASGLGEVPGIEVVLHATNMVFVSLRALGRDDAAEHLAARGIKVLGDGRLAPMRLVTHLDVNADDVVRVVAAFAELSESGGAA